MLATLLNVPVRLEPIAFMAAMVAMLMSAAIRPYSIAVAPSSSFRALIRIVSMPACSLWVLRVENRSGRLKKSLTIENPARLAAERGL